MRREQTPDHYTHTHTRHTHSYFSDLPNVFPVSRSALKTKKPIPGSNQITQTSDVGLKHGGVDVNIEVDGVLEERRHALELSVISQNLQGQVLEKHQLPSFISDS